MNDIITGIILLLSIEKALLRNDSFRVEQCFPYKSD